MADTSCFGRIDLRLLGQPVDLHHRQSRGMTEQATAN